MWSQFLLPKMEAKIKTLLDNMIWSPQFELQKWKRNLRLQTSLWNGIAFADLINPWPFCG
jgi:hypothetical protein